MNGTFGDLIRQRREKLGVKSYELAQRIQRQPSIISRIETGAYKEVPPVDVLAGLSRELGISQVEMLAALGYDVRPSVAVNEPPADPLYDGVIEELNRTRLTADRADTLRGLLERWQAFDRRSEESIYNVGTSNDQGGMRGVK